MGAKVIIILFIIFAMGVGLFVARSGILTKLGSLSSSSTIRGLFPTTGISSSSGGAYQPKYQAQRNIYSSQPVEQPAVSSPQPTQIESVNPYDIPAGFTAKDLSPNFHKVRIGTASPGFGGAGGQISLYGSYDSNAGVDVSGWRFEANNGSQIVPAAIDVYDPLGLARETDVYLKSGDTFNLYFGASAIGKNLRLNKCIGYIQNTNVFDPPLPQNCPYVDRSEISRFTGQCQDYIYSLGYCKLPDSNPPVPETDYACRSYLENFNYKGCFTRYRADPDFLSHEWRGWTGAGSSFLDERHDVVMLLDKQGLLVDLYQY